MFVSALFVFTPTQERENYFHVTQLHWPALPDYWTSSTAGVVAAKAVDLGNINKQRPIQIEDIQPLVTTSRSGTPA